MTELLRRLREIVLSAARSRGYFPSRASGEALHMHADTLNSLRADTSMPDVQQGTDGGFTFMGLPVLADNRIVPGTARVRDIRGEQVNPVGGVIRQIAMEYDVARMQVVFRAEMADGSILFHRVGREALNDMGVHNRDLLAYGSEQITLDYYARGGRDPEPQAAPIVYGTATGRFSPPIPQNARSAVVPAAPDTPEIVEVGTVLMPHGNEARYYVAFTDGVEVILHHTMRPELTGVTAQVELAGRTPQAKARAIAWRRRTEWSTARNRIDLPLEGDLPEPPRHMEVPQDAAPAHPVRKRRQMDAI